MYAIKDKNNCGPVRLIDEHSRFENKFLHAQDGLFSEIYGDFYYLKNGKWPSVEGLYQECGDNFFELRKIMVSTECAADTLRTLDCSCGISISTMMPDYTHVAEQVKKMLFK